MSSLGKKSAGSGSGHGHAPPFKRARSQDVCIPDAAAFMPLNSRTCQYQQNPLENRRSRSIFYKTRLCGQFLGGDFPNGEKCTFAHGSEDLHEPRLTGMNIFMLVVEEDEQIVG
ncbi:hypothetical protein AgCh_010655 [Apium graveolens]